MISDDGKGFAVEKSRKGLGLASLGKRIKQLDGSLSLHSEADKGTGLTVQLPFNL